MNSYFEELLRLGVPKTIPKDGFCFEDLFDEFVANTQKTWSHDRAKSVGASEAFGCLRKTWFSKRGPEFGFKKDEDYEESWGAIRRGDMIENHHIVPAVREGLQRRGLDLIMEGDDQETIVDGVSSATLDGLIIDPSGGKLPSDFLAYYGIEDFDEDSLVLEMKSIDPRIDLQQEKGIHRGQTQMQMGLIRDTTDYNPNWAIVLYVNASWVDDIKAFPVEFDPEVYELGRNRAERVFAQDDPAMFMAEGKLDGSCEYCPFEKSCRSVSTDRVPPKREPLKAKEVANQDQELISELDEVVHQLAVAKQHKKDIEHQVETLNEEVRQKLIAANQSRAVGDDWKASYTTVKGKKTLSKEKLIEAGHDPEDFMQEGSGYEKLTVTMAS